MLIIVDKKMPGKAREALSKYGEVVELATKNICYEAVSGHPDIFLFQTPGKLIVAPNLPEYYKSVLEKNNIKYIEGNSPVGKKYPATAHYNALFTKHGILFNSKVADVAIKSLDNKFIHCNQAYVRCNAIEAGKYILTSDKGIEKTLLNMSLAVLYVNPEKIVLPGHKYGFFGGCCGIRKNKFFVCGSLKYLDDGQKVNNILYGEGFEIIELYDGQLFDVGGIFFV